MGGFCGGGAAAAPKKVSEASKVVQGTVLATKGGYKSPKTGFQQVKDDIQMDLGMKDKDVDYYARIDDRAARSKAAMDNLGKDIFGRPASDDSPAPAAPAAPTTPAPVAKAPEVPKPPKPPGGPAKITKAPEPGEKEPAEPAEPGVSTAASGEAEAAAIEATAEGEAETKVADTARKGRRKTIATSAKGLLSAPPVRKRRSLMGGLLA
jgi:hypothetical protein